MSKLWLKFGCFLIGYKYQLLKQCSTASEKAVIKYTSAVLLVCLIWSFIGYEFTQHYLHGQILESVFGSLILSFAIIQIERQIILTIAKNNTVMWLRGFLAVAMAFIGSIIIDQIIFKEDVAKEQVGRIEDKVNEILPKKIALLNAQIKERDSLISKKESERANIIDRVRISPTINVPKVIVNYETDSTSKIRKEVGRQITNQSMPNPEANLIQDVQTQIDTLRNQKLRIEANLLTIRDNVREDLIKHPGFFDELNIIFSIIFKSVITSLLYIALWLALFAIELLVLFSKLSDGDNDYSKTVLHQMNIRIEQLEALNKERN